MMIIVDDVIKAQRGCRKTENEILTTLRGIILGKLLKKHGDYIDCEDATQRALLKIHKSLPKLTVPQAIISWSIRIGYNEYLMLKRTKKRWADHEDLTGIDLPDEYPPSDEVVNSRFNLQRFVEAIVNEKNSEFLFDYYMLEEQASVLAKKHGVSTTCFKSRVHRLRSKGKQALEVE